MSFYTFSEEERRSVICLTSFSPTSSAKFLRLTERAGRLGSTAEHSGHTEIILTWSTTNTGRDFDTILVIVWPREISEKLYKHL